MHIPTSMLSGAICPVTTAVAVTGIGAACYSAIKSNKKPSSWRFASVTALIFALQMLNYPVQNGTSGHLLGSVLAVSLLGVPFAVLAMSIVLAVQCVFFADGGIIALGANILNMSLIGVGVAGLILHYLSSKKINKNISLAIASILSVLAAAVVCSFEVAISGTVALAKVLPAMLSVHTLIGLGEGVVTVCMVLALSAYGTAGIVKEKVFAIRAFGLSVLAACLSPLASGSPDGLEWVAAKLSFVEFSGFELPAFFPDYQVSFFANEAAATILAGIIGVGLVSVLTFSVSKMLNNNQLQRV